MRIQHNSYSAFQTNHIPATQDAFFEHPTKANQPGAAKNHFLQDSFEACPSSAASNRHATPSVQEKPSQAESTDLQNDLQGIKQTTSFFAGIFKKLAGIFLPGAGGLGAIGTALSKISFLKPIFSLFIPSAKQKSE